MMLNRVNTRHSAILMSLFSLILWVKPVSAADWVYSVRPGDTLWSICQQYAKEPGCWQKLGPFNEINRNRQIPPGTRIRMPATWLKSPAASATIVFSQGNVTYQHAGEPEATAEKGIKLPIGTQVTTGQGTVTILFADGSSMVLEPDSQLVLDSLSSFKLNGMVDSTVRLNRGTVKTRVIKREPRSQFRTITPSAVASVRGTEYRVNAITTDKQDSDKTRTTKESTLIEVYEGLVDVGAEQKTYPVPASFGIVTEQGQAPKPPVRLLERPSFIPFDATQTLVILPSSAQNLPISKHAPLVISWQAMANASKFQLNILSNQKADQSAEQLLQSYRVTETHVNITDLSVGCYQLSLRAIDKVGLHGLAAQETLCVTKQLSAPMIDKFIPLDGYGNQANITWEKISDALTYRIEASEEANFKTLLHNSEVNEAMFSIEHASPLFFRVQARDQNGVLSSYSQALHWQPQKAIEPVAPVETAEYWPIYVQIGLFLLALL